MIYQYKKNFFCFLLLLTWIIIAIFLILITSSVAYCAIYRNKTDLEQKIKQLTQISDAHSQCLIQLQQQLFENQQDLDKLQGCVQNIEHHIAEIVQNQKESYKTLNQLSNQNTNNVKVIDDKIQKLSVIGNTSVGIYNQNKKDISNTEEIDYKAAVGLVLEKKQYIQAIQLFQDFIKKYPKSHYQPNAHYWLGQLYYNQGNKNNASYYFALVVKNYPQSSKASDALLKIGIIMQETNQIDKAKIIYRQIGKLYPNSDSSKQAQKRLLHLS